MKKVVVIANRYVDSVSLMAVSAKVMKLDGVTNAESGMGTPANLEVLIDELGYDIPEVTPNDLIMAVTADTEEQTEAAMKTMRDLIDHKERVLVLVRSKRELAEAVASDRFLSVYMFMNRICRLRRIRRKDLRCSSGRRQQDAFYLIFL